MGEGDRGQPRLLLEHMKYLWGNREAHKAAGDESTEVRCGLEIDV